MGKLSENFQEILEWNLKKSTDFGPWAQAFLFRAHPGPRWSAYGGPTQGPDGTPLEGPSRAQLERLWRAHAGPMETEGRPNGAKPPEKKLKLFADSSRMESETHTGLGLPALDFLPGWPALDYVLFSDDLPELS